MSYLFHLNEKGTAVLHPEAVKLCPELRVLNDKEVLFIILVYDYNSIYRQYNERDRLTKAIWHIWQDNKPDLLTEEKRPKKIKLGIEAYKSLQYNRNQELIFIYQQKIESTQREIISEDSPTRLKQLRDIIMGFRKDIHELENEILEDNRLKNDLQLQGDRELSLLEEWKSNKAYYTSITSKK